MVVSLAIFVHVCVLSALSLLFFCHNTAAGGQSRRWTHNTYTPSLSPSIAFTHSIDMDSQSPQNETATANFSNAEEKATEENGEGENKYDEKLKGSQKTEEGITVATMELHTVELH